MADLPLVRHDPIGFLHRRGEIVRAGDFCRGIAPRRNASGSPLRNQPLHGSLPLRRRLCRGAAARPDQPDAAHPYARRDREAGSRLPGSLLPDDDAAVPCAARGAGLPTVPAIPGGAHRRHRVHLRLYRRSCAASQVLGQAGRNGDGRDRALANPGLPRHGDPRHRAAAAPVRPGIDGAPALQGALVLHGGRPFFPRTSAPSRDPATAAGTSDHAGPLARAAGGRDRPAPA